MNMKLLLIAAIVASASATSFRQRNINARLNAERSVANKALSALHNAVRSGRATGGHTRGWDRNGNSGTHFVRSNGFGSLGSFQPDYYRKLTDVPTGETADLDSEIDETATEPTDELTDEPTDDDVPASQNLRGRRLSWIDDICHPRCDGGYDHECMHECAQEMAASGGGSSRRRRGRRGRGCYSQQTGQVEPIGHAMDCLRPRGATCICQWNGRWTTAQAY